MDKINSLTGLEILDSGGNPTLQATVTLAQPSSLPFEGRVWVGMGFKCQEMPSPS
ncbi:hypothetical protein J5J83_21625 [Azoarcus sp. L1K30]|uniref:hypothetical protein n=1 Tax=Azoarcus sp. L1K30 TaxID=2820277 RepID=UPI001B839EC6|nr:hypothetical protein [Azoarcus sp. L1K30]MBR0568732.1 hypothetical protein [Azoarcus sp. L1K30]